MKIIITLILIPIIILGLFYVLSKLTKFRNKRTRLEVSDILERFLEGKSNKYEWDDFLCSPIRDRFLEDIRLKCADLRSEFPDKNSEKYCSEEGNEIMRKFVQRLRSSEKS